MAPTMQYVSNSNGFEMRVKRHCRKPNRANYEKSRRSDEPWIVISRGGGGRDRPAERNPDVGKATDASVCGSICRFRSLGGEAIDQLGIAYNELFVSSLW